MELLKKTISQCLALRTRETPQNAAMEYRSQSYTWEEVHRLSDYLAIRMMTMGIGKGDLVGLWSVDTPNWILTFLALAKTGAVPVLIDTGCREQELGEAICRTKLGFLYYGDGWGSLVYESMADRLRRQEWCRGVRWVPIGRDSTGRWMSDASFVSSEKSQIGHKRLNRRRNQVKPQDTAVMLLAGSYGDGAGSCGETGSARRPADRAGFLALTHWELVNSIPGTWSEGPGDRQNMVCLEVSRFSGLAVLLQLLTSIHVGSTMDLKGGPDPDGSLPQGSRTVWFPRQSPDSPQNM